MSYINKILWGFCVAVLAACGGGDGSSAASGNNGPSIAKQVAASARDYFAPIADQLESDGSLTGTWVFIEQHQEQFDGTIEGHDYSAFENETKIIFVYLTDNQDSVVQMDRYNYYSKSYNYSTDNGVTTISLPAPTPPDYSNPSYEEQFFYLDNDFDFVGSGIDLLVTGNSLTWQYRFTQTDDPSEQDGTQVDSSTQANGVGYKISAEQLTDCGNTNLGSKTFDVLDCRELQLEVENYSYRGDVYGLSVSGGSETFNLKLPYDAGISFIEAHDYSGHDGDETYDEIHSEGESSWDTDYVWRKVEDGEVTQNGDVSVNFSDVSFPELTVNFHVVQPNNVEEFDGSVTIKLFDTP